MIDIILPCYKSYDTIIATINSIKAQTFNKWFLIVVIDGYDEKLINLVDAACSDIEQKLILRLQKNQGVANARNVGLNHSKSEFIAFIDSDDIWIPEKLDAQMKILNQSSQVAIVGTGYLRFRGMPPLIQKTEQELLFDTISPKLLRQYNPFCFSSIIIRRSIIGDVRFTKIGHEDYDFLIKIWKINPYISMINIRNVLVYYRLVPKSVSGGLFQSVIKSLKIRAKHFGLTNTLFTFMFYVARVLKKRYR